MADDSFFSRHLHDAGESYFRHLAFTARIGAMLVASGLVIIVHGLLPFLFEHTGSNLIDRINAELKTRREECEKNKKAA